MWRCWSSARCVNCARRVGTGGRMGDLPGLPPKEVHHCPCYGPTVAFIILSSPASDIFAALVIVAVISLQLAAPWPAPSSQRDLLSFYKVQEANEFILLPSGIHRKEAVSFLQAAAMLAEKSPSSSSLFTNFIVTRSNANFPPKPVFSSQNLSGSLPSVCTGSCGFAWTQRHPPKLEGRALWAFQFRTT